MTKNRNYRPISEIISIFHINANTIQEIVKRYKIDNFTSKWKIFVNIKDFYKVYTNKYNPALFDLAEKKKIIKEIEKLIKADDLFGVVFSRAYKPIIKNKKIIAEYLFY